MLIEFIKLIGGNLKAKAVAADTPLPTTPLRSLGTAFNQAVTTSNASFSLPVGTVAVHINVVGCNARIRFGAGAQTAVATDQRIIDSVPYDLAVPDGTTHMGIIADSGAGTLSGSSLVA